MTMALDDRRERAASLYTSAKAVAFGGDGAVKAAQSAAAGSVSAIDDQLTERDKRMLAIGTLAGAGWSIARACFPQEDGQGLLDRTDLMLELAVDRLDEAGSST
jgi:hypothetical protein